MNEIIGGVYSVVNRAPVVIGDAPRSTPEAPAQDAPANQGNEEDAWGEFAEHDRTAERERSERAQQEAELRRMEEAKREAQRRQEAAQEKSWCDAQERARARAMVEEEARNTRIKALVEAGDLDGVLEMLARDLSEPGVHVRFNCTMRLLRWAVENVARHNPYALVAFLQTRILAFETGLMLRAHQGITNVLSQHDRCGSGPDMHIPPELVAQIDRVAAIHASIQETVTVFSRAAHTIAMCGNTGKRTKGGACERHTGKPKAAPRGRTAKRGKRTATRKCAPSEAAATSGCSEGGHPTAGATTAAA